MTQKSMGQIINSLRREKGMTQKELADMLNITDKAVSKWERDAACPDTLTIPKLAEILGISRAGAYALFHSEGFPCIRIGKRMLVQRDAFLQWLDEQQKKKATTE